MLKSKLPIEVGFYGFLPWKMERWFRLHMWNQLRYLWFFFKLLAVERIRKLCHQLFRYFEENMKESVPFLGFLLRVLKGDSLLSTFYHENIWKPQITLGWENSYFLRPSSANLMFFLGGLNLAAPKWPNVSTNLPPTMSLGLVTRQMHFIPNTKLKQPGTWEAKDKSCWSEYVSNKKLYIYINTYIYIYGIGAISGPHGAASSATC